MFIHHRWLVDNEQSIDSFSLFTVLVHTHYDAGFPSRLKIEIMGNWKGHQVTGLSKVAEQTRTGILVSYPHIQMIDHSRLDYWTLGLEHSCGITYQ